MSCSRFLRLPFSSTLLVAIVSTCTLPIAFGQQLIEAPQAVAGPPQAGRYPAVAMRHEYVVHDGGASAAAGNCETCRNCPIRGVDCQDYPGCGHELRWRANRPLPWQVFAHGEYVGPSRVSHVPEYRLRVDDTVVFVYRLTREISRTAYELNVGDKIRVESLQDENLDRELVIQPDGTITLRLLGQITAAGLHIDELRANLEKLYEEFYKEPTITVTPIEVNTKLEDLRSTVDNRAGQGGQSVTTRVSPDGTVQLPAVGSVPSQGLTLSELKREVDERYRMVVDGIEVTPVLQQRAPRFVYVVGDVNVPGRYEMTGPTSAMMAIGLASGAVVGGNLREVVVFRRAEDWRLMATKLDLRGAMLGKRPVPSDEIWLRDSDVLLIPSGPIKRASDLTQELFRGTNDVLPLLEGLGILRASVL